MKHWHENNFQLSLLLCSRGGATPTTPRNTKASRLRCGSAHISGQAGLISGTRATERLKRKMGDKPKRLSGGGAENDRLVFSVHRGTSWNLTWMIATSLQRQGANLVGKFGELSPKAGCKQWLCVGQFAAREKWHKCQGTWWLHVDYQTAAWGTFL